MKHKIKFLLMTGLAISHLAASAQETQPTPDANTTADPTVEAAPATPATEVDEVEAVTEIGIAPAASEVVDTAPIIPLIVMDEVPLTDAIKNLARQAGINYMLDPRINFGQPGPDGRPVPQPNVSIRWENISAQQALNAMLNNYSLQMVEDTKTKISRITVIDPAAPPPLLTKIIQLKYAGPSNILASAQTALVDRRSKLVADVRTSQLVVLATENEITAIDEMIAKLDLPTRQVLIEARLMETSMNPSTIKGLDWTGTLQGQNLAFGNHLNTPEGDKPPEGSANPTLSTGFPKLLVDTAKGFSPGTAFLDADGVNAVFSFLNKNSDAKVISAPRTVTLDNETASIAVTRQIPILTTSPGSANTPGGSSITYSNLGVILNVTPRISADNRVNLKVLPEVSRVFNKEVVKSGGLDNTVYTFDSRTLVTTVVIPSAHTLVLGGLVQDDTRTGSTKVPGLGDIPFLGRAFRSDSKERSQNNLLIFITPTIVEDGDFQPTASDFLKNKFQDPDTTEWSAWDSGKKKDWSKRGKKDEPQFADVP